MHWSDRRASVAVPDSLSYARMAGIGASCPLRRIPAIVSFLDPAVPPIDGSGSKGKRRPNDAAGCEPSSPCQRNWKFESIPLQQRVCELSFPSSGRIGVRTMWGRVPQLPLLPAATWLRVCFNGRRRTLLPATLGSRSRAPMVAPMSAANRKTRPRQRRAAAGATANALPVAAAGCARQQA